VHRHAMTPTAGVADVAGRLGGLHASASGRGPARTASAAR
jgi:hypothetical protein